MSGRESGQRRCERGWKLYSLRAAPRWMLGSYAASLCAYSFVAPNAPKSPDMRARTGRDRSPLGNHAQRLHAREIAIMRHESGSIDRQRARCLNSVRQPEA